MIIKVETQRPYKTRPASVRAHRANPYQDRDNGARTFFGVSASKLDSVGFSLAGIYAAAAAQWGVL